MCYQEKVIRNLSANDNSLNSKPCCLMIILQCIATEFRCSNDNVFAQFLISTFICPAPNLRRCKISRQHACVSFEMRRMKLCSSISEWEMSQLSLLHVLYSLSWNVRPQMEVVETGRELSRIQLPLLRLSQWGLYVWPV